MILQGTYAGILHFIFSFVHHVLSMFYMFIDGNKTGRKNGQAAAIAGKNMISS